MAQPSACRRERLVPSEGSTLTKLRPAKTDKNPKGCPVQYGVSAEEVKKVTLKLAEPEQERRLQTACLKHKKQVASMTEMSR